MMKNKFTDTCKNCSKTFEYELIHNGFNESAHVYCNRCGMACVLHDASAKIPKACNFFMRRNPYHIIDEDIEQFLTQCICGGNFMHNALPRCPNCNAELTKFKEDRVFKFRTVIINNKRSDDCWKEVKRIKESK